MCMSEMFLTALPGYKYLLRGTIPIPVGIVDLCLGRHEIVSVASICVVLAGALGDVRWRGCCGLRLLASGVP